MLFTFWLIFCFASLTLLKFKKEYTHKYSIIESCCKEEKNKSHFEGESELSINNKFFLTFLGIFSSQVMYGCIRVVAGYLTSSSIFKFLLFFKFVSDHRLELQDEAKKDGKQGEETTEKIQEL